MKQSSRYIKAINVSTLIDITSESISLRSGLNYPIRIKIPVYINIPSYSISAVSSRREEQRSLYQVAQEEARVA